MILIDSIRHLGPLSIIAPVAIGLYNYRFLKLAERLILLYLIIGGAIDAILFLFIKSDANTIHLYQVFTQIEFIFVSTFYILILKEFINYKKLLLINILILITLLVNSYIVNLDIILDSLSRVIVYVSIFIYSFIFIFEVAFSDIRNVKRKSIVILNYGFLFYSSTSLFIYLFGYLFTREIFIQVWQMSSILTVISNLLFALALWKTRLQTAS